LHGGMLRGWECIQDTSVVYWNTEAGWLGVCWHSLATQITAMGCGLGTVYEPLVLLQRLFTDNAMEIIFLPEGHHHAPNWLAIHIQGHRVHTRLA